MSKKTVTIEKHAHYLREGDRLLGKGSGRVRLVISVELPRGAVVARFARGSRKFAPLDRVRVRVK